MVDGPIQKLSKAAEKDMVPVRPRPLPITSIFRERSVGLGTFTVVYD